MSKHDQQRWDDRYRSREWGGVSEPSELVVKYAVGGGQALDVACGRGQNTLWLAENGYYAVGVDISRVALRHAAAEARRLTMQAHTDFVHADLEHFALAPESLDLICVLRFLHRPLYPVLRRALRPGGRLIYSTLNWRRLASHPLSNPLFLLQPGELIRAFDGLQVLLHSETSDMTTFVAEHIGREA